MAALIQQQDGFFFCGGTRSRVINTFRPNGVDTLAMTTLRQKLRNGAMWGGSSAGMASQVQIKFSCK
jgi:cyanophycinase-like exopeptidase